MLFLVCLYVFLLFSLQKSGFISSFVSGLSLEQKQMREYPTDYAVIPAEAISQRKIIKRLSGSFSELLLLFKTENRTYLILSYLPDLWMHSCLQSCWQWLAHNNTQRAQTILCHWFDLIKLIDCIYFLCGKTALLLTLFGLNLQLATFQTHFYFCLHRRKKYI